MRPPNTCRLIENKIARRPSDGPDYKPWWRFLVMEQHVADIALESGTETAIAAAVGGERDAFVRQLLRWHFDFRCVLPQSIEYALRCSQTRNGNKAAAMIAAMVVAGCSATEIAGERSLPRLHVVAFEKIFWDVRPYLKDRSWIKELSYDIEACSWLGQGATRMLITATERGWPGLHATYFGNPSDATPAGAKATRRIVLGLVNRVSDEITRREIEGTPFTADELDLLSCTAPLLANPEVGRLDHGKPFTAPQLAAQKKADELVRNLPLSSRKKLQELFQKLR